MILALALCLSAAAMLAWLTFSLAIYALPVAAGALFGWLAYSSGSGLLGASVVALVSGAFVYAVGHVAIERSRSPAVRLGILILYITPAALAGYGVVHGLAGSLVPNATLQTVFSMFGSAVVAASAWAR
ncbi:hypothetical protein ACX4M0_22215, partial [Roseomonas mucosa]